MEKESQEMGKEVSLLLLANPGAASLQTLVLCKN